MGAAPKKADLRPHRALGARLQALRTRMSMSRPDLARKLCIRINRLLRIELGQSKPSHAIVAEVSGMAGVPTNTVLSGGRAWDEAITQVLSFQPFERSKPAPARAALSLSAEQAEMHQSLEERRVAEKRAKAEAAWMKRWRTSSAWAEKRATRTGGKVPSYMTSALTPSTQKPSAPPAPALKPCETDKGCPVTLGRCIICNKDVDNWDRHMARRWDDDL